MADLNKLDHIISELEISSNDFKQIADMLKSMETISAQVNKNTTQISEVGDSIDQTEKVLRETSDSLQKLLLQLTNYEESRILGEGKFISEVNALLLQIKSDNYDMYAAMEKSIANKLSLHESTIAVALDAKTNAVMTFVDQKLISHNEIITQKLGKMNSFLYALCTLSIVGIITGLIALMR